MGLTPISLRNLVFENIKKEHNGIEPEWIKEIPFDTRAMAVKDAVTSYNSSMALYRNNTISHFKLNYKVKQNKQQIFNFDNRALKIKDKKIYLFKKLFSEPIKLRKRDRIKLNNSSWKNSLVMKEFPDTYYFVLRIEDKYPEPTKTQFNTVAIDRGSRTLFLVIHQTG